MVRTRSLPPSKVLVLSENITYVIINDSAISTGIERTVIEDEFESRSESSVCSHLKLPMTVQTIRGEKYYNTSFAMYVASEEEEGLYNLYFHNCPNYKYDSQVALDFTVRRLFLNCFNLKQKKKKKKKK